MSKNKFSNEEIYPRCLIMENEKSTFNNNEDFCSICQKHFCNKYYLKKHKLDVHKTLVPDSTDINISHNSSALLNENSSSNHFYNLDINYVKQLFNQMSERLKKETEINDSNFFNSINYKELISKANQIDPSYQFHSDVHDSSIMQPNATPGELAFCHLNFSNLPLSWHICFQCNLRFPDELSLSNHSHTVHRIDTGHGNGISDVQKQFFQNIQFLSSQTTNQIDEILSSNTLDAFKYSMAAAKLADRVSCDICGKDLCNKYFLRTHRKKVHGIKGDLLKSGIICHNISYPLERLEINTEKNNYPNHSEKKISISDPKSNPWNQFELNLDPDCRKLIKLESKYPVSSMPQSFSNKQYTFDSKKCKWIRKPLANKVKCDICDRLICNKYFLKTHKYKKHGIQDQTLSLPINSNEMNYKISFDSDIITTQNNLITCTSSKTSLPNIFNYLDYRITDKKEQNVNKSSYHNIILPQKEEPLDLSLPKQALLVHSRCTLYKTNIQQKNKLTIRKKLSSLKSTKTIAFYRNLISKYLGLKSESNCNVYIENFKSFLEIRFFCRT